MVECLPSMVKTLVPGLVPQKDQGGLEPVAGWVSEGRRKKPCGEGSLPRCLQKWWLSSGFNVLSVPFPCAPRTLTLCSHSEGPWSSWYLTQD